jgi:PAS domain S-box-containing protein
MVDDAPEGLPRAVFDSMDMGIILLNQAGRVVAWNAWFASASSISETSAFGKRLDDLFSGRGVRQVCAAVANSLESGTSRLLSQSLHPALLPLKTRSGQNLLHDVTVRAVGSSATRHCLIQVSDVTVATRRERHLRERQNARYDAVVESAPDVILTLDDEDKIQFANPAAIREFGYRSDELIGQPATTLFFDPTTWLDARRAALDGDIARHPIEVVGRRKDRSLVYLEVSLSRWMSESRTLITAILRDITERRAAEQVLRASESQFRTLAQALPNHAWTALPNGEIDWVNDRVSEYSGLPARTYIGETWSDFVNSDDRTSVRESWSRALESGEPFEAQFRLPRADGVYRWHIARAFPSRGLHDAITQWVGSNTDIEDQMVAAQALASINTTLEQRVAERTGQLLQAEEALRQSQKMEAIGQLTGGIAHDFNNLLQGIIGGLDIIRKRISQGRINEVDRFLDGVLNSANRAATLTHRLLAFSRRQPIDPRVIDINKLITTVAELLRRSIGESIELEIVADRELWPVRCDENQLENALLNLAINARDAMPEGGKLKIVTANTKFDSDQARRRELAPGEFVSLRVSDNGIGMSQIVKDRAFDPFYTTKPIGKGTGLGLSMIYGFVRQSDGSIEIGTELGKGTTIEICLPRYDGAVTKAAEVAPSSVDLRAANQEVVLIVEDEAAIRTLIVEVLDDLGYRALETADSAAALRILQSAQRVDLLISDIGLPGLNGRQLADAARVARHQLKVLFVTGYAEEAAGRSFLEPGMEIITKPFSVEVLAGKIKATIQAGEQQRAERETKGGKFETVDC